MLYLFSSIYDDVTILPQFLAHYIALGVERVVFNVNTYLDPSLPKRIAAFCEVWPVSIEATFSAPQTWAIQNRLRNSAQTKYMNDTDWALIADLDEFQEYPASLRSVIEACEQNAQSCIHGVLLDRVSSSGVLSELNGQIPVAQQYPFGAPVTREILRAPDCKIVAVRGCVRPSGTCVSTARFAEGDSVRVSPINATIHHYKWHLGVLRKLRERAELYERLFVQGNSAFRNYEESKRFIDHYNAYGRIALEVFNPHEVVNLQAR